MNTCLSRRLVSAISLLCLSTHQANASGMMMGGDDLFADLFVVLLMIIGLALTLWIVANLISRRLSDAPQPQGIWGPRFTLVYLGLELWAFHELDISSVQIGLFVQIAVLIIVLILWTYTKTGPRVMAMLGVIGTLIAANLIDPKLIDFRETTYLPSYTESQIQLPKRGLHWRHLVLEDGRQLIRLHHALQHLEGKPDHLQPVAPHFSHALVIKAVESIGPSQYYSLMTMIQGNTLKPGHDSVFIHWPLLTPREVLAHDLVLVGSAVKLDEHYTPDPQLLVEAIERPWEDNDRVDSFRWVRLLLKHAADPDAISSTSGRPLLLTASYFRHRELIPLLIDAGANPNATDRQGNTALHLSVTRSPLILSKLLERGVDPTIRNDAGYTAEQWARHKCQKNAQCASNLKWMLSLFDKARQKSA